jgi:hypothetical protein
MENIDTIKVKGRNNTIYEGKEGVVDRLEVYDSQGKRVPLRVHSNLLVLWDGEEEKVQVELLYLDILG